MKARLDFRKASPTAGKAIGDLHAFVHRCGFEHARLELMVGAVVAQARVARRNDDTGHSQ